MEVQLLEVKKPEFKEYIKQVKKNTGIMFLSNKKNLNISTGGSDNHIILIDLRNLGLTKVK